MVSDLFLLFQENHSISRTDLGTQPASDALVLEILHPSPETGGSGYWFVYFGFPLANELEDIENSKKAYEKFLQDYPDHVMAKDAKWEIEHLGQNINEIEELTTAPEDSTKEQ